MKKAILDTSFILTAVRQKVDFFNDFQMLGVGTIIPKEVISELEGLSNSNKMKDRQNAELALKIIEKNSFEKLSLGGGNVDKKIINFARQNPSILVATLDEEIKKKVKSQKVVIRGKNKIDLV